MFLFISFFCQEWNVRYHYREVHLYAYNLLTVTGINLRSCKKSNRVSAEKIQCLDDKNEIFHSFEICLYVCNYLPSIKKSLKIVHSLILQSINKTKGLNIHHRDNSSFRHGNKATFSMINNTK